MLVRFVSPSRQIAQVSSDAVEIVLPIEDLVAKVFQQYRIITLAFGTTLVGRYGVYDMI